MAISSLFNAKVAASIFDASRALTAMFSVSHAAFADVMPSAWSIEMLARLGAIGGVGALIVSKSWAGTLVVC